MLQVYDYSLGEQLLEGRIQFWVKTDEDETEYGREKIRLLRTEDNTY